MAEDSELALWSEVADAMAFEMAMETTIHCEGSARGEVLIEQQHSYLRLLGFASQEATDIMMAAQRGCNGAVSELDKWSSMLSSAKRESDQASAIQVADLEASSRALREEVSSLSALRDQLRQEVAASTASLKEQQIRAQAPPIVPETNVDEETPSRVTSLKTVRSQLEGIREHHTPTNGSAHTPTSGAHWRARLLKLQGDLRSLRSELSTSPYRGE